jgi:Chlorophyll A-B binding protein
MTSSTKEIPSPNNRNSWNWGFTSQAEIWNGRIAMIGFMAMLLTELLANQGVLHFWNLMKTSTLMQ